MMAKILLVEDDENLNKLVSKFLSDNGYDVFSFFDGASALNFLEEKKIDLIITDVMMPRMDGFELAKNVRFFDKTVPILFMTARDDISAKEKGYKLGIDDYLVKPFDFLELKFRIEAILRRAKIEQSKKIEIGNLLMDIDEHTAYVSGKEILLTVKEFDILFKLLSFPKKTFTRTQLMEEFWDYDSSATSRTVDVHIVKLREKTKDCDGFELLTVHGLGYKAVLK